MTHDSMTCCCSGRMSPVHPAFRSLGSNAGRSSYCEVSSTTPNTLRVGPDGGEHGIFPSQESKLVSSMSCDKYDSKRSSRSDELRQAASTRKLPSSFSSKLSVTTALGHASR